MRTPTRLLAAYKTPLSLSAVFVALLIVFAFTPDPTSGDTATVEETAEPTAGPRECIACPIDQTCEGSSGRCVFIEHTPLPCVETAEFDEEAGFCLPEDVPPPPAPVVTEPEREVDPGSGVRVPREGRQPRLPGFGNDDD